MRLCFCKERQYLYHRIEITKSGLQLFADRFFVQKEHTYGYFCRGTRNMRRSSGARKPGDLIKTIFIISTPYYVGFGKEKFLRQAKVTLQGSRKMLWAGSVRTPHLRRRQQAVGCFWYLSRHLSRATPPFDNRLCTARKKRSYSVCEVRNYVFDQWMGEFQGSLCRSGRGDRCRGRTACASRTGCKRCFFCTGRWVLSQSACRDGPERRRAAHAGISRGAVVHHYL